MQNKELLDKLVFSPNNRIYAWYNRLMISLNVISSIVYAFMSAFRNQHDEKEFEKLQYTMNFIEILFFVNMVANCFKEYIPQFQIKPVKKFKPIFANYLANEFFNDLIPLIPFQILTFKHKRERLFYLIKIIRINSFLKYYSKDSIRNYFKVKQMKRIE